MASQKSYGIRVNMMSDTTLMTGCVALSYMVLKYVHSQNVDIETK
jgi:hypothetical protein